MKLQQSTAINNATLNKKDKNNGQREFIFSSNRIPSKNFFFFAFERAVIDIINAHNFFFPILSFFVSRTRTEEDLWFVKKLPLSANNIINNRQDLCHTRFYKQNSLMMSPFAMRIYLRVTQKINLSPFTYMRWLMHDWKTSLNNLV
jgi:hypothetical protein